MIHRGLRLAGDVASGGEFTIAFVAASGNGVPGQPPAGPHYVQSGGTAELHSSIFYPSSAVSGDSGSVISFARCLIFSDVAHAPEDHACVGAVDPLFVGPATGDL